jgi:hypothetical protein
MKLRQLILCVVILVLGQLSLVTSNIIILTKNSTQFELTSLQIIYIGNYRFMFFCMM